MNLQENYYNSKFSHIYIEKKVINWDRTKNIISHFPNAEIILIDHYKDVFCRRKQNFAAQHLSQNLIIAAKEGNNIYQGAKVCQSFGNEYFYYTSCVMNCLFDCDYCYLKGMYPSGNMVIFVNLEDTFNELENILKEHKAYVCVSYDTDLMAIEDLTGFVNLWQKFTYAHPELRIEIRTKSARNDLWHKFTPCDRVIFAYTVSPKVVADFYEHGAGSLEGRVAAAKSAMEAGFKVRLCFDPMIYCKDWKIAYGDLVEYVMEQLDYEHIVDFSVGSFRISQEYMKKMRKSRPELSIVQFPYENVQGYYQYPTEIQEEMEGFMMNKLAAYVSKDKIFKWKED